MKIVDAYKAELEEDKVSFFVIDSGNHSDDRDFQSYTWRTSRNNKIREGDLFIYKKPQKLSENHHFYIYGTGKIGKIVGEDRVNAKLVKTFQFLNPIFQTSLEEFDWKWKTRGSNWKDFWLQYGITKITKDDFINLVKLVDNDEYEYEQSDEIISSKIEIESGNYYVPDAEAYTKTRPWQRAWSNGLKADYSFRCAICGISTPELLVGSHIVPVSEDENNRKNPANGICLCVLHDKAFDRGFITIDSEYRIIVSQNIPNDEFLSNLLGTYNGKKMRKPKKYAPNLEFLRYHRINIFKD
jgi:putative restriction endonuclease